MNGLHNSDVEIVSLSNNNEFRKLKDLYGDIKFPPTVTWNFEYMVLVKKTH